MAAETAGHLEPLEFISEDALGTFDGWLKYQAINLVALTDDEAGQWRELFEEGMKRRQSTPKVGRMKLKPMRAGEYRYAVTLRDRAGLWITLWIRRSPKGEIFVFQPRADRGWNPHTSYHSDGTVHLKSHDKKMLTTMRQPLTGAFRGSEHLGAFMGHAGWSIGATCVFEDFTGVFEVGPRLLAPRNGQIVVDLLEPGASPLEWPGPEKERRLFAEANPNILIRLFAS